MYEVHMFFSQIVVLNELYYELTVTTLLTFHAPYGGIQVYKRDLPLLRCNI